jgi:hypothetical protein
LAAISLDLSSVVLEDILLARAFARREGKQTDLASINASLA